MVNLDLAFDGLPTDLSVRSFHLVEQISQVFHLALLVVSADPDLDLDAFTGRAARFGLGRAMLDRVDQRVLSGVCTSFEQIQAEETGLSTYRVEIAPRLALLTHRQTYRIFQHMTAPDIARKVLEEWSIDARWRIDVSSYPLLDYRVQHGESDLVFVSRVLEDAGISYWFALEDGASVMVLTDQPHAAVPRSAPVSFVDNATRMTDRDCVARVSLRSNVRAGRFVHRDIDHRGRIDVPIDGFAAAAGSPESQLEQFAFEAGRFAVGGATPGETPSADDKIAVRVSQDEATARALRALERERSSKRVLSFETSVCDLVTGCTFNISGHPRADVTSGAFLVTRLEARGRHDSDWSFSGQAVPAGFPYRPPLTVARPRVHGLQSALVVGPPGSEIHADEYGRVRVQFHWDREGARDDKSSCWIRVSQGWAGPGHGLIALPRVGHEVLVAFLDGDPDQPVVVGRVYNAMSPVPYKLPDTSTQSGWRTSSSPGGGGFNELMFEDAKGQELVNLRAERNLNVLVGLDQSETVARDVHANIGRDRAVTIARNDSSVVGLQHNMSVANSPTGSQMNATSVSQTTGDASLSLNGGDIGASAAGNITAAAGANAVIGAGANIGLGAGADLLASAGGNVGVLAGADISLTAGGNVSIDAAGHIAMTAGGDVTITAGGTVIVKGGDVIIKGGTVKVN